MARGGEEGMGEGIEGKEGRERREKERCGE